MALPSVSNNLKIPIVLFLLFYFHDLISPILFHTDDGYYDDEDKNLAHGSGSIVAKKPKRDV